MDWELTEQARPLPLVLKDQNSNLYGILRKRNEMVYYGNEKTVQYFFDYISEISFYRDIYFPFFPFLESCFR
jgi:hypothetical protein